MIRKKESQEKYDSQFKIIFEAIKKLIETPIKKDYKIGFLKT